MLITRKKMHIFAGDKSWQPGRAEIAAGDEAFVPVTFLFDKSVLIPHVFRLLSHSRAENTLFILQIMTNATLTYYNFNTHFRPIGRFNDTSVYLLCCLIIVIEQLV